MAAKKHDPSLVFPKSRKAYEGGASLQSIKRKMKLTESELRDACPEEFEDEFTSPRNGY